MGVLEVAARIVQLGGDRSHADRVAGLRAHFEARTGPFAPEDPWFEERSRAFWVDALTRGGFGHDAAASLDSEDIKWLRPFACAHRGLFRAEGDRLIDVWSRGEFVPTVVDEASRAELDAASGQLFDARLVGGPGSWVIALLPGAVFHPRDATDVIETVLEAARASHMKTHDTLDALLRMERTLRALSRVKAAYAYRADALTRGAPAVPVQLKPRTAAAKGS